MHMNKHIILIKNSVEPEWHGNVTSNVSISK